MKVQKLQGILAGLVVSTALLAGCEGGGNLKGLSDDELVEKVSECVDMNEPGPAMVLACENYQRECKRRREETGIYVC